MRGYGSKLVVLMLVGLCGTSLACAKRSTKLSKAEKESLKAYILDDMPADVPHKVDVNFDDKVHMIGWKAEPEKAEPGTTVNFTIYWRKTGDLDPDWKLFTHITTDNVNEAKGNLDCVGAIRQEKAQQCSQQLYGPSDWEKGKVIIDTFSYTVPTDVTSPTLRFLVGVWKGEARLQIRNKESADDANRANVISLPTGAKAPDPAPQKTELPSVNAPKFGKAAIKLDGKLDEPEWQKAGQTGPFVSPGDGKASPDHPVNAVGRLAWDDNNLYAAITVDDKDPVAPFKATDKDPHLWEKSSAIELMIQPGDPGDNKDYYEIQVDTSGAIFDTHWDDYNVPTGGGPDEATKTFGHMEWSSGLKAGVSVDKGKSYTIELAIPWKSFAKPRVEAPPKIGDTWRVNLYSFKSAQSQALAWSPILGQGNFHKSARFGLLRFVNGEGAAPAPSGSASSAPSGSAAQIAPPALLAPPALQAPKLVAPIKVPAP
jgi:hypothetical protein